MRPGLAVSAGTHAVLLGLGLISLGWAEAMPPPPVESIAVDLVPIAQFSNIRVGDLKSTVVDTEAPSAVDTETPPELAKPTGNTEDDQVKPLPTPTPSPAPTQSSAPEPAPEPEVEPLPRPVAAEPPPPAPSPPEPAVQPAPAPPRVAVADPQPAPVAAEPMPELAAPSVEPDPVDVAPEPKVRTAALDQMRADYKKQQAKAAADEKARKDAEAAEAKAAEAKVAEAKAAEEKKRKAAEAKKLADAKAAEKKLAALAAEKSDPLKDLIDENINLEDSRGATTGKGGQKTLGDADGRASTLSQSEIGALVAQIRGCINMPAGAEDADARAEFTFSIGADGRIGGKPVSLRTPTSQIEDAYSRAVARALQTCGPYMVAAGQDIRANFAARESF